MWGRKILVIEVVEMIGISGFLEDLKATTQLHEWMIVTHTLPLTSRSNGRTRISQSRFIRDEEPLGAQTILTITRQQPKTGISFSNIIPPFVVPCDFT